MTTPRKSTAAKAVATEATTPTNGTKVTFEFEGNEYTVDTEDVMDIEFLEAYEDGRGIGMVRELLGAAQWSKLKGTRPLKGDDVQTFTEVMFKAMGTDPGK
jgi:hypothetical protein